MCSLGRGAIQQVGCELLLPITSPLCYSSGCGERPSCALKLLFVEVEASSP